MGPFSKTWKQQVRSSQLVKSFSIPRFLEETESIVRESLSSWNRIDMNNFHELSYDFFRKTPWIL